MTVVDSGILWIAVGAVVVLVVVVLAVMYGGGDGSSPTSPGGY